MAINFPPPPISLVARGSGYDLGSANHMHLGLEFRTELIGGEAGHVASFVLKQTEQKCWP